MDRESKLKNLGQLLASTPDETNDAIRCAKSMLIGSLLKELQPMSPEETSLLLAYKKNHALEAKLAITEAELTKVRAENLELKATPERTPDRKVTTPEGAFRLIQLPDAISTPWQSISTMAWPKIRNEKPQDCDLSMAYVMSCFSEIAYLHIMKSEIDKGRGRYKYFPTSEITKELLKLNLSIDVPASLLPADIPVQIIERKNFVYLAYRLGGTVIVAVRGTVLFSIREWLIDLNFRKERVNGGLFHRGFWCEANEALNEHLLPKFEGCKSIRFTGHSLGAAVASILSQIWPKPEAVAPPYVFASPRFGSREVTSEYKRFGFRRPADPVPHLPPAFLGFSHEGLRDEVLRKQGFKAKAWSALQALQLGLPHHSIGGIRSHLGWLNGEEYRPSAYIDAIKKAVSK